ARRAKRNGKASRAAGLDWLGLILDSSLIISAERQGQTAYQMIEGFGARLGDPEIAVSVVTVLELAHGIARADTGVRRSTRQQFLDDLLTGMPVHVVNVQVALRAGHLDGSLQSQGIRVALADLLIGATALELGYSVATHNVRHFRLIPSLPV
ncbi:MAG: PIN domain-containing protein, partial [Bryobacteraceae bacterium]|nr:PIN domain-containing protein [Bryobacteraceae bacterium]